MTCPRDLIPVTRDPNVTSINDTLIDAIESWEPLAGPLRWPDDRFDALALEVFGHQYAHNEPFRRFCDECGARPDTVATYRDIPAVPTDVFKVVRLSASESVAHTFLTSGTTREDRGAHHFATLDVYRAALQGPFERFCNPEGRMMRLLVVAPSPADYPEGSLSFMLGELVERWGDAGSGFFVGRGEGGELVDDFEGLAAALDGAVADGVPTMVLGTAFGFVGLFDSTPRSWQLPEGSRVMETGGLKGRTREVSRDELYDAFTDRLGVPRSRCISEYSMTELSSQAYTDVLEAPSPAEARFRVPPWVRVEIVDPVTLRPIDEPRRRGLIRWVDLANVNSVCVVQTSDLGIAHPDGGFELLGRAPDAELRGCSLTIEEILDAARGL